MRLLVVAVVGLMVIVGWMSTAVGSAEDEPDLSQVQMEQISYGLGFYPGREMRLGLEIDKLDADLDLAIRGFADALKGDQPMVPEEQLHNVLVSVQKQLQERIAERLTTADPEFRERYDRNLQRSRLFHEEFGKREGVVTLPDGVQYKVLRPGTGASPEPSDIAVLNVRMLLTTGREVLNWKGTTVRVDRLIAGGAQILPLMKSGARWVVAVPPQQAFGAGGRYPDIGPNETLIFQVELLEVLKGAAEGSP